MDKTRKEYETELMKDYPGFDPEVYKTVWMEPMKSVAPGIFWLRMPLPFQLNHINLWLLRDGNGWCIVDTGFPDDGVRETWRSILQSLDGPVTRLLDLGGDQAHDTFMPVCLHDDQAHLIGIAANRLQLGQRIGMHPILNLPTFSV